MEKLCSACSRINTVVLALVFLFAVSHYGYAQVVAKSGTSVPLSGSGFENPTLGMGSFQYSPISNDWVFGAGTGISANGSGFTAQNPNAPAGLQVAFVQGSGRFAKSINISNTGKYTLSALGAQRAGNQQALGVYMDNVLIGEFKAQGTSYVLWTSDVISVAAGTHTLEIRGLNPLGGDHTMFLDDIKLAGAAVWSNPTSWNGGIVPTAGQEVEIPYGISMVLDANVNVKSVMVNGTLTVDMTKDITITTNWIMIHGNFVWGTEANPYTKKGKIVLTGTNTTESIMGMGTKLIGTMGSGIMRIHGKPKKSWTMLNASVQAGATEIIVQEPVDWEPGDEFIVSSTTTENDLDRKLNYTESEKRMVVSVSADRKTIRFATPLLYDHYGKLQTFTNGSKSWVLDERAEVGLLTRNIMIMGDEASEAIQFGGHMMSMNGSKAFISGVEMYRMGQAGVLGRYPFHWHLAGDVTGEFIKNCSVHHSYQRAITVHGTQNAIVEDNVCFDIKGHAIFLEDGNETNTLIKNNLVVWVHKPTAGKVIRPSDIFNLPSRIDGPAGIWVSHPTNHLLGNAVSSCGSGIWYAILDHPDGPSYDPTIRINDKPLGEVSDNRTHACYSGFIVDFADVNGRASTEAVHYHCPPGQVVKNATSFDCMRTLWWRGNHATFENFRTSNSFTHQGANVFTFYGTFLNGLMVGHTEKSKKKAFMSYGTSMYDGNHELVDVHFENFDQHDQALITMIGGASKNLPLTMERCTKKNARVMHISKLPVGNPEEFNVYSSMIWDKTGEVLGAPNRWAVLDHPYLIDNTFAKIDNQPDLGGFYSTNKFARLRFVIHDITEQTKSTLYSDWSDGHVAHNRPLGPHWEMPVMVNSNRLYRFRMTDYTPKKLTISFGEARTGDRIRFFVEGLPQEMIVASNPDWPYNNGTALRRVYSMAEYNAASDNVYYYENGKAYFHLVARYTNDERTENLMISSPSGSQLGIGFVASRPYLGVRHNPGQIVQAEHFDHGGQGVAYYEKRGNDYLTISEFKNSDHIDKRHGEMVDLTRKSSQSYNFYISDIKLNEWWNYSYAFAQGGTYQIKMGVSSPLATNQVRVLINGNEVSRKSWGINGDFVALDMGNVTIAQGNHTIRIEALTEGFNIDWLSVQSVQGVNGAPVLSVLKPAEGTAVSGNVTFEASAYDPNYGTANGSGITGVKFELRKDNFLVGSLTDISMPYTWAPGTGNLSNGLYQLTVIAQSADNQNTTRIIAVAVDHPFDCAGVLNGTAFVDGCGKCAGGNTGIPICADTLWDKGYELYSWAWGADVGFVQTEETLELTAQGGNAHFWSPDYLSIPTDVYRYFHIRMKNNGSKTSARINWFPMDNNGLQGSQQYSVSNGDAGYKDYVIDLKSNPNYKGVLKRILLQATEGSTPGDRVSIDRIEFSRIDRRDCNGVWRGAALRDLCNVCVGGNTGRVSEPSCNEVCVSSPFGQIISLPGIIEAENYDQGGENCSYHDNDATNLGTQYRTQGVDIEVCGEGGFNVGWIGSGEWMNYTTKVLTTSAYRIDFRVASISGGSFHLEVDGVNITGTIQAPVTGAWQTYATVSKYLYLTAGDHKLTFVSESNGFNLDKISVVSPAYPSGNGTGLTAQYFNGMNFETAVSTRIDAQVNFNWGGASPLAGVNSDQFSVRWSGKIEPRFTEEYTFIVNSDNGRRVWVNNVLLVDKWIDDWNVEYSGKITLTAGQKYDIRVEMFENAGGAGIKLEWMSASQLREIIPASQLFPIPVVANQLPTISLVSPVNGSGFVTPTSITMQASASDADGSVSKVEFYAGNILIGIDLSAPYSIVWSNVAPGTYVITARATDNVNGVAVSSSVTVQVNAPLNTPPVVSLTSPAVNAVFTSPASITMQASASDADGSISKVEFYAGNVLLASDLSAPYAFTWTNVASGTYSLVARATDNLGAVTHSVVVSVEVKNPVSNCTTVSLISTGWVLRNNWSDQNSGSTLSNEAGSLKATHRQWGQNYIWLISTAKYAMTAGVNYTFNYEVRGNVAITSTELGLAGGYQWDGPQSLQSVVAPAGYVQNAFNAKSVTLKPANTGSYHIAIRINLNSQPPIAAQFLVKGLAYCVASNARLAVDADELNGNEELLVYPNPFGPSLFMQPKSEITQIVIYSLTGEIVLEAKNLSDLSLEIPTEQLPMGSYILWVISNGKTSYYHMQKSY